MNLKTVKSLIKKYKADEDEILAQRSIAKMKLDALLYILDKNNEDLQKETEFAMQDINLLTHLVHYRKSIEQWNVVIERDLDVAKQNMKIIEDQLKEAFIERKKFETVYNDELAKLKKIADVEENKFLDDLAVEIFNRKAT